MVLLIFKFLLWIFGWKTNYDMPEGAKRSVVIAVPHTSNWDFVFALAALDKLGINPKFTIKKEFDRFPFGAIITSMGALWIDRSPKDGNTERRSYTEVMTELMMEPPGGKPISMVITPEGTRGKRAEWKLSFYYVAKNAGVPISLGYLDYEKKEVGIGKVIYPTDDMAADMKQIMDFYKDIKGKFPENSMMDERYA